MTVGSLYWKRGKKVKKGVEKQVLIANDTKNYESVTPLLPKGNQANRSIGVYRKKSKVFLSSSRGYHFFNNLLNYWSIYWIIAHFYRNSWKLASNGQKEGKKDYFYWKSYENWLLAYKNRLKKTTFIENPWKLASRL